MTSGETLKQIANFNPSRAIKRGTVAPFVDMAALPTNGRDVAVIAQRAYQGGGSKFKNGDTLFARITPCLENGKTAKMFGLKSDEVAHGSTEFIVISAKEPKYDENFIYYLARLPEFRLYAEKRMEGTSGRQRVSWQAIESFPLKLPDNETRAKIGTILASIDDKISMNQRMNETLEAMARALFKSWFVDFDPVRAKAEGRKPKGMDAATAALFPAAFNDDGLPEGWEQTTLEKIADLNSESWSNANHPDDVEYVDLANTKWGTIESTQHFSWSDAPSRARRVLRPGDTIVGTVRPGNGSFSFIGSDGLTGSTGFAVLRPKKEIYREAVCYAATSKDNIDRLAHLADGGAYPAVRPDVVLSTPYIFPGDKILAAYSQSTATLLDRAEINKQENKMLAEIRDALLPKLISGELRVEDQVISVLDQLKKQAELSFINKGYVDIRCICNDNGIPVIEDPQVKKAQIVYDGNFYIKSAKITDNFSIAHELGHYALHPEEVKKYAVGRKDECSLSKDKEQQAEEFASEIMMPEKCLHDFLKQAGFSENANIDDKTIKSCAKQFRVSEPAMRYRLNNLGYKTAYKDYKKAAL